MTPPLLLLRRGEREASAEQAGGVGQIYTQEVPRREVAAIRVRLLPLTRCGLVPHLMRLVPTKWRQPRRRHRLLNEKR
jgi:hypothetical protein